MSSANFTIYTLGIGTLSYMVSFSLRRIQDIFCSYFHSQFSSFCSTRYPSLLGGQWRYGVRRFAWYLYKWVNFSGLTWTGLFTMCYRLCGRLWGELIVLSPLFVVHEIPTWRCHSWCTHYCSFYWPLILFSRLLRCIFSTRKRTLGCCVIGECLYLVSFSF